MTDLAALTASLGSHYGRTRVTPPAGRLRRTRGDSPAPAGGDRGTMLAGMATVGRAGDSSRQRIRRPGTDREATFRPDTVHFAYHPVPATARVPRGGVSRTQAPGKLTRRDAADTQTVFRPRPNRTDPETGATVHVSDRELYATFDSTDDRYRQWQMQRHALMLATGDLLDQRDYYPDERTRRGNPGPPALYGDRGPNHGDHW